MYMSVYDEMRAEGRAEAKAEGWAEGLAQGKVLGKIEFLVHLLTKRGLLLEDELLARVDRCTDEAQVQCWFDRAFTATTLAAVFDEPSPHGQASP